MSNNPKFYWSCVKGKFVNKTTGKEAKPDVPELGLKGPQFTGNTSEWYESLIETCISMKEHLKGNETGIAPSLDLEGKLMAKRSKLIVPPDILHMFESSCLFKPGKEYRPPPACGNLKGGPYGRIAYWFDIWESKDSNNRIVVEHEDLVGEVVVLDLEEQK